MQMQFFFMKTPQSGWLFYLVVLRDVNKFYVPLFWESRVGKVGQKVVKYLIFAENIDEILKRTDINYFK